MARIDSPMRVPPPPMGEPGGAPVPPPPGAMAPGAGPLAPMIGGPEATPPVPAPMATPEPKEGLRQAAMVNVQMAIDLLTQSLPALGSTSDEGDAVLNAVKTLSKRFGKSESKTKELIPAEILQMIKTLPQAGGRSPEAKAIMGAPIPALSTPPTPM